MIKLLKRIWQPLPVAILSFSISLTAGAIGLEASATAAHEAKNRAVAVQAIAAAQVTALQAVTDSQNQKMRELLCGYFEPASVLPTLTPEQKTRITKTIKLLGCTPDVTDGK